MNCLELDTCNLLRLSRIHSEALGFQPEKKKEKKKKTSLFERGTLTETTTDIFWARLAEFYTDLLIILNIFICV